EPLSRAPGQEVVQQVAGLDRRIEGGPGVARHVDDGDVDALAHKAGGDFGAGAGVDHDRRRPARLRVVSERALAARQHDTDRLFGRAGIGDRAVDLRLDVHWSPIVGNFQELRRAAQALEVIPYDEGTAGVG